MENPNYSIALIVIIIVVVSFRHCRQSQNGLIHKLKREEFIESFALILKIVARAIGSTVELRGWQGLAG